MFSKLGGLLSWSGHCPSPEIFLERYTQFGAVCYPRARLLPKSYVKSWWGPSNFFFLGGGSGPPPPALTPSGCARDVDRRGRELAQQTDLLTDAMDIAGCRCRQCVKLHVSCWRIDAANDQTYSLTRRPTDQRVLWFTHPLTAGHDWPVLRPLHSICDSSLSAGPTLIWTIRYFITRISRLTGSVNVNSKFI